ncbi:MAG: tetratricopeptide repeat protein [Acidobacteriota bacterium]
MPSSHRVRQSVVFLSSSLLAGLVSSSFGLDYRGYDHSFQARQPARVQQAGRQAGQLPQADFEALKKRAEAARDAENLAEAITHYKQLVKLKPRWAEGWWYLGTLHYDLDQYAAAVPTFKEFVGLEPQNGQGWVMLGLCEYRVEELAAALHHLAKGRSLGLGGNDELARVARYHQAVLLTRGQQFEAAIQILNGFGVEHRESSAVLDALGLAVLRIAEPLEKLNTDEQVMVRGFGKAAFLAAERKSLESRRAFETLLSRYGGRPNVAYALGSFLLTAKDPDAALQYFQQELQRDAEHVAALLQVSLRLVDLGKYDEALPYALKAKKLDDQNFVADYVLGRIYLELKEVAKAIEILEAATKAFPQVPSLQFVLARAYARAQRPADAARARAEFTRLEALVSQQQEAALLESAQPVDATSE